MTVTPFDFTRPPPLAPDLRANLAQWLGRANVLLVELLAAMSVSVELRFDETSTVMPAESLSQWTDKSPAIRVNLKDHDEPSLIAMPNPLVQELVSRILGDEPDKLSAERELTPAERSISEFLVETIVRSLKETWQGKASIDLSVGEAEANLRRTKLFRPTEPMLVCRSILKTPLGESHWCWMLSNEFLAQLFGIQSRAPHVSDAESNRRHLEQLIRSMQSEIEIRLGSVQLSGPQLARLRVGDVVVLDQRVSEPLRASIRGEPKFRGWAGRVGNRQAFEVESEILQRTEDSRPQA